MKDERKYRIHHVNRLTGEAVPYATAEPESKSAAEQRAADCRYMSAIVPSRCNNAHEWTTKALPV